MVWRAEPEPCPRAELASHGALQLFLTPVEQESMKLTLQDVWAVGKTCLLSLSGGLSALTPHGFEMSQGTF